MSDNYLVLDNSEQLGVKSKVLVMSPASNGFLFQSSRILCEADNTVSLIILHTEVTVVGEWIARS